MADKDFNLKLKIEADAVQALREIAAVRRAASGLNGTGRASLGGAYNGGYTGTQPQSTGNYSNRASSIGALGTAAAAGIGGSVGAGRVSSSLLKGLGMGGSNTNIKYSPMGAGASTGVASGVGKVSSALSDLVDVCIRFVSSMGRAVFTVRRDFDNAYKGSTGNNVYRFNGLADYPKHNMHEDVLKLQRDQYSRQSAPNKNSYMESFDLTKGPNGAPTMYYNAKGASVRELLRRENSDAAYVDPMNTTSFKQYREQARAADLSPHNVTSFKDYFNYATTNDSYKKAEVRNNIMDQIHASGMQDSMEKSSNWRIKFENAVQKFGFSAESLLRKVGLISFAKSTFQNTRPGVGINKMLTADGRGELYHKMQGTTPVRYARHTWGVVKGVGVATPGALKGGGKATIKGGVGVVQALYSGGGEMFSGALSSIRMVSGALSTVGSIGATAFKAVWGGAKLVGSVIKTVVMAPIKVLGMAFQGLKSVGTMAMYALGTAVGAVYAGLKALGPASEMQQASVRMRVLLKDAGAAKKRMAELTQYAKETNFTPGQIIEAGNLMEAFGFYSTKNLKLAGNAANAFGKDINEIIRSLNYLASGRGGEAFESLSRIGITRNKLKPYGLNFAKSGEMLNKPKEGLAAVLKYFEKEFGDMTTEQGKTWQGSLQKLGGEVYNSFSRGLGRALAPLSAFVRNALIPVADAFGDRLESLNIDKLLTKPLQMLTGAAEILRQALDPASSKQGLANIKTMAGMLKDSGVVLASAFGNVVKAFIHDMAVMFEQFTRSGGFKALAWLIKDAITLAGEGILSGLSMVLNSFSARFQSGLRRVIEVLPMVDAVETRKVRAANVTAARAVNKDLAATDSQSFIRILKGTLRGMDGKDMWVRWQESKVMGATRATFEDWKQEERGLQMARTAGAESPRRGELFDKGVTQAMGWDSDKGAFYRDPAKLAARWKATLGSVANIASGVTFATPEMNKALGELKAAASNEAAKIGTQLNTAGKAGALRGRYDTLISKEQDTTGTLETEAERLRKLRAVGWDKDGTAKWGRTAKDYARISGAQDEYNKDIRLLRSNERANKARLQQLKDGRQSANEFLLTPPTDSKKTETGAKLEQAMQDVGRLVGQQNLRDEAMLRLVQRQTYIFEQVMGV